jgi:hypothetical protein
MTVKKNPLQKRHFLTCFFYKNLFRMSDLQIVIKNSENSATANALCIPGISHITFSDSIIKLTRYTAAHSTSYAFIVLVMDLEDPNLDPALEELTKQKHLFELYICVKPRYHLTFTGENVFPIAKQLITRKITSSVIRFFELTSKRLLAMNHIGPALLLKEKANVIKQQRFTNGQVLYDYLID